MESSHSSVIQFNDGQIGPSELQFQDFTLDTSNAEAATLNPSTSYTTFPESPELESETADLLSGEKKSGPSIWEFSYYQSFFDVDTDQVLQRILYSMIPLPGRATFLDRQIRPTPDLYGPFWISSTLVFSTAICANIASYLTSEGHSPQKSYYDFHKVSLAATAIYSYVFILPIILWGLMWYRKTSNRYTLLEILCVYGYSLAIYVPISVLWVIQVAWFQWIILIIAAAFSGTVLIQTFWPIFKDDSKKIATVVLCLMLLCHVLLAVGFVTYFFQPPNEEKSIIISPTANVATSSIPSTKTAFTSPKIDDNIKNLSLQNSEKENLTTLNSKNLIKAPSTKSIRSVNMPEITTNSARYYDK